jgi:hypothetical protein
MPNKDQFKNKRQRFLENYFISMEFERRLPLKSSMCELKGPSSDRHFAIGVKSLLFPPILTAIFAGLPFVRSITQM